MEKPLFSKLYSIENELKRIKITSNFASLNKKVNPYKACIYGLCRDFLDGVGYDLGTKLTGVHDKVLHCNIRLFNLVAQIKQFEQERFLFYSLLGCSFLYTVSSIVLLHYIFLDEMLKNHNRNIRLPLQ